MGEEVVFKGSSSGLKLILAKTVDFPTIENLIKQKLDSSFNFFQKGTVIELDAAWVNKAQKQTLQKLFATYDLVLNTDANSSNKADSTVNTGIGTAHSAGENKEAETTIINQTIRNGQEVIASGSVLINGNVNPGANVVAGGNIDVRGACRGIVHAGAFGNINAVVTADYLIPMQIRIADLVARAPDKWMTKSDVPSPEKAYANNGQIVLEAINR